MKTLAICALGTLLLACGPSSRTGGDDGTGDDQGGGDDQGSGSGSGSGSDTPRQCNKMDIVFVVDDSGSMQEEQSNLASNFPMFATLLSNYTTVDGEHIDYRVALTTTGRDVDYTISIAGFDLPQSEHGDNGAFKNNCGNANRWLTSADQNVGATLGCRASVGTSGPSLEMPLLMAKWGLDERVVDNTNVGFLRDDALLAVVFLTDEDDHSTAQDNFTTSSGDGPMDWAPQDQVSFFDQLKGNRTRWAAAAIAGDGACTSSFGDATDAPRLKQFVQLANGNGTTQAVFSSICAGDLTIGLKDALDTFQAACGGIIL